MWPYCDGMSGELEPDDPRAQLFDWECIRGCVLGLVSLGCGGLAFFSMSKVLLIYLRTRHYRINLVMLSLASLQCLLTSLKYVIVKDQKLTFAAGYCRGLQTLITCALYAKSASRSWGHEFFSKYYFPILGLFIFYLSVVFLVAIAQSELACYHPHWILMSASQFLIWVLFSIPGLAEVVRLSGQLGMESQLEFEYEDVTDGIGNETRQQHRKLAVLLMANGVGAVSQVILDVWLQTFYVDEKECVVFYTGMEELLRIILKIISYDVPVIATIYVYYHIPLKQFQKGITARLENRDTLDEAFSVELLESTDAVDEPLTLDRNPFGTDVMET